MADEGFKRKLTAILSADVEGYSRLMGEDEEATVRTLTSYREIMTTLIRQHNGKVLDSPGDNLLAEFVSVVDAVQCAVAVQKEIKARNSELPENRRMQFRIGINLGDVIQEKDRIYGDGVNIAARLEGLAEPGGICISKTAFDHIESKLPYGYDFIGDQTVKNIAKPVGAYRVLLDPRVTISGKPLHKKLSGKKRMPIIIGVAAIVVLAIAVGVWQYYIPRPTVEPASVEKMAYQLPAEPSIAVLPFVNMSEDPKQEYLSDGITESIITVLSNVRNMFVISRNSTFTYKNKPIKIKQVAEDLGVRYVLEGSIQKTEDRVRITAQLIDALTGKHLWAERFDRNLKDLFALQDEITMNIVNALKVKLTEGELENIGGAGTDNLDAYLKYLQSRKQTLRKTKEGNALAQKLIQEAIALDPEYTAAYLILSATHLMDIQYGLSKSPGQSLKTAEELLQKAISLSGVNADAHAFLGRIYLTKGQYNEAIAEGKRAVEMAPNSSFVYAALAYSLKNAGRPEEAIALYKKAIRLSPISDSWYLSDLGHCYGMLGRYEEGISVFKKAISVSPESPYYHAYLAAHYFLTERENEARAEIAKAMEIDPKFSSEACRTGQLYKDQEYLNRLIDAMRKAGLPEHPPLKMPDKPSLAVLPFVNMSDDPKQAYFSDGITENIIMALSKTPKLFVIARNSTFAYKDKPINIKQAAKELGVRYILEGSVQKTENRVRITAQLIDAATGRHQWAERYDRELKDIFALQDEITLEIITALQVELTEGEQSRIHRGGTTNLEAFLKILKGREHHFRFTREELETAKRMYREAIALDPKYATAYFWLAYAIDLELNSGWSKSREKDIERLFELSEKILALDDSSAQAHIVLSRFYAFTGQPDRAITEIKKAIDLDPNDADGYAFGGLALFQTKRFEESILWFKKAIRRNPSPPLWYLGTLCAAYIGSGQHHEAIITAKKLISNYPDRHVGYFWLGVSYFGMGNYEEAIATFKKSINIAPTNTMNLEFCAVVQSMAGKHEEAIGMVKKAIDLGPQESQNIQTRRFSHLAEYYRRLGRYKKAIDTSRKLLDSNPNDKHALRAYVTLTCAYSALGSEEDARAAAAEVLRISPNFSMEAATVKDSWAGLSHYGWFLKHEADKNLLVNALRKAGLN